MTRYRVTAHVGRGTIAGHAATLALALEVARELRDANACTVTVERGERCVAVCTPREVKS